VPSGHPLKWTAEAAGDQGGYLGDDCADAMTLASFTGEPTAFVDKHDGTPVTQTDIAVEQALRNLVAQARPDDAFLGEETGLSNDGSRLWIVDPIDGTRSFAAGGRQWGTLIALSDHGRLTVGVASAVVP